jgi:hypothetical protein
LLYVQKNTLMAVSVEMPPGFQTTDPKPLFNGDAINTILAPIAFNAWDVHPDGQHFIITRPVGEAPVPAIMVVENWSKEFESRK